MTSVEDEEPGGPSGAPSVRDHRYGTGDPFTIGIEEEYMILDADSLELACRIEDVIEATNGTVVAGRVHPELTESCTEVATHVCRTVDDARRDLLELRRTLGDATRPLGLRIGGAGAHPFSLSEDQRITANDRYRALVEQLQYVARRESCYGMHVHVAMPSQDVTIRVMEGLLPEVPLLLALSTNSPFWRGKTTGLASTRVAVFSGFPRSGLPPRFENYDDYAEMIGWMEATGVITDYTNIWWDIRPHPRLGTLELRVPDVQFDVEYTLSLAAYIQCCARESVEKIRGGEDPPALHRALIAENKWLATRYGVDAQFMDLTASRRQRVGVPQLVRRRLRELMPHARELECADELAALQRIVERGTGAQRQLRVYNANQDLIEVMSELSEYTVNGGR